jgi:hypothetical protein
MLLNLLKFLTTAVDMIYYGKGERNVKIKIKKVATGHNPPAFRCGKWQDSRTKRERTRAAQRLKWSKEREV